MTKEEIFNYCVYNTINPNQLDTMLDSFGPAPVEGVTFSLFDLEAVPVYDEYFDPLVVVKIGDGDEIAQKIIDGELCVIGLTDTSDKFLEHDYGFSTGQFQVNDYGISVTVTSNTYLQYTASEGWNLVAEVA